MQPVVHDALENISQRYIQHLRIRKQRADEDLQIARSLRDANVISLTEATNWQIAVDEYWHNVKTTEKTYHEAERAIARAINFAEVITENTYEVQEAVETLVCVVRETSRETDVLKNKIQNLKNRLSTVTNKGNKYLAIIIDLETKVAEAIKSNELAIRSVLDLLKEVYLLHISLSGKTIIEKIRIVIEERWLQLEVGHENWMEFYEKIKILEYLPAHPRGLADNLYNLQDLLMNDHAYPLAQLSKRERDALPIAIQEADTVPSFPLKKEDYFRDTHAQHLDAEKRQELAEANKKSADAYFEGADARSKALEAALTAAGSAKVATGGILVTT